MRDFITLVEQPVTVPERAYDILYGYVTHGEMTKHDQFDADFQELATLVPRPAEGMTLYRVLRLTDEQVAAIQNGGLTLEMRNFSSWTKDHGAAIRLTHLKRGDNGTVVIVTARFPAREILIDVADFYESNFFTRGYDEYWKYVRPEQEVIVNHSGPIRLTDANTEISTIDTNHISEWPQIGDKVFYEEQDDAHEIEDVDHEQDYAARGIFYVDIGHDNVPVRKIGDGEWEVANDFYGN